MKINELQIILLKIEKKFGKSLVIETLSLYLRIVIH